MTMQSPHRCGDSDVTQHATAHMYSHVCYIVCAAASFFDVWGARVRRPVLRVLSPTCVNNNNNNNNNNSALMT